YSFSEYEDLIKQQKEASDKVISMLKHGVYEYRANYIIGSPAAKYAHDMINAYKEDDSGMLMGDLLLDNSVSEDRLSTIFMQSSGAYLSVIKRNLALACTPYGKDDRGNDKVSWMERLSNLGPLGIIEASRDDSLNIRAITLKQVLSMMVPDIQKYLAVQEIIDKEVGTGDFTDEQEKIAMEIVDENYTPENKMSFSESATSYAVLKNFKYEDWYRPEIKTLADLVMQSQELESYDFHAMAKVLTEAEYQMISIVGATPFINTSANTEENWQKIRAEVTAMDLKKAPVTSIYDGVDRELFNGKVAMTSDSIRANNMNSDTNILYGNINQIAEIAMLSLMATSAAIMIGASLYAGITKTHFINRCINAKLYSPFDYMGMPRYFDTLTKADKALFLKQYPNFFVHRITTLGKVFFSAMAILAVVMIVFAAIEIAYYYKNDYTTMPLIMMDS
ncbi:MAG: hypothetical protein RR436_07280, partial [Clostridia bacterium]